MRPATEPRPFASLSAGLLARKGQAKPAMRPQPTAAVLPVHDDLGWNDMGQAPSAPVPITQQAEIAASLAVVPEPEPTPEPVAEAVADVVPVSRARGDKAKAAFTLRLDPERHLRLRLACAVDHRSAQQIVTDALDAFLDARTGLDALRQAVPSPR